jgi:putative endonuclease
MTQERLSLGQWGEDLAAHFLQRKGLKILARNLRTPVGEIDIVARQKKTLVLVEVKTRRTTGYGTPAEAVGPRKQRQIIRAAQWYLADAELDHLQPRFDVVSVLADEPEPTIEHIPGAFEA